MIHNREEVDMHDHDARCVMCSATIPCEEPDCTEPAGHEYMCPECVALEGRRPVGGPPSDLMQP
ncbi:MAG: hypothetical protein KatS3mg109_0416 [Pirellulaceae bacterium]|nr:MAG: hypothetical protein KatS3mg109_0416 [Pirellulaceae bacterium]